MLRPEDLDRLLAGETDRVEWKESTGQRDPILNAVCAFANDLGDSRAPGWVVIGVRRDGGIAGIESARVDEEQRVLADRLRSSKIQPVPSTTVTMGNRGGATLLVVEVTPYNVPPIVQVDGVAWVRVGTTTRRATDADLQRLAERRPERTLPFDTRPARGATIDDLASTPLRGEWTTARELDHDHDTFPAFEDWLTQRQLGRRVEGVWTPNTAALLLHGKSPQDHVPAAFVDLVRYGGSDHDAPVISRRTASGTLVDQLDVAWAWIAAQIDDVPDQPSGVREAFVPTYPLDAAKELVRNLVQHRLYEGTHAPGRVEWFDDRIEFSNPGGPFGRASEGEFGTHSDYRNPLVTAGLVRAGYVQQLGRGVRRVRLLLEKSGNPRLEVSTDGFTRVVMRRHR